MNLFQYTHAFSRKIADKDQKQVTVPDSPNGFERPKIHKAAKHRNYDFKYTENPFGFQVIRSSDNQVIFDTTEYPIVFEDQYLELTTSVPDNANLYGFGETTRLDFKLNSEKVHTSNFSFLFATGEYSRQRKISLNIRILPLFTPAMLLIRKLSSMGWYIFFTWRIDI